MLTGRQELGIRTYISEPDRGRRRWHRKRAEQPAPTPTGAAFAASGGKRLLRRRGELLERSFAHCYDTGGMRRVHLRGRLNIAKRLLVQAAAFNLGPLLRRHLGTGKPRGLRRAGLSSLWGLGPQTDHIDGRLLALHPHPRCRSACLRLGLSPRAAISEGRQGR